jgi:hypothetical protein
MEVVVNGSGGDGIFSAAVNANDGMVRWHQPPLTS